MNYKKLKWLLLFLSGILLVLSYPPFNFAVLPFFSLLPLFFFLNLKNIPPKKSFLAGFITGFIFLGGVMLWLFDTFPLNWLGVENSFLGFLFLFSTWLLLTAILAAFFGLFSLSLSFLSRRNFWDILLIPSLWIIFDYLRIWAFGLYLAGSESILGPHWTFGNLAYTVAHNPSLRFLASIGGIYLVTFLIILINTLFFFLIKNLVKNKPRDKIVYSLSKLGRQVVTFYAIIHMYDFSTREISLLSGSGQPIWEQT